LGEYFGKKARISLMTAENLGPSCVAACFVLPTLFGMLNAACRYIWNRDDRAVVLRACCSLGLTRWCVACGWSLEWDLTFIRFIISPTKSCNQCSSP